MSVDEEGFASIYLNARQSYEQQKKGLRHALRHIAGDDFYNNKDIRTIEREADGRTKIIPPPPSRDIDRDMSTLRRIGIITDWRDDPLLNIPDYE